MPLYSTGGKTFAEEKTVPPRYWRAFSLWSNIVTAICVGGGIWLERSLDLNESYFLLGGAAILGIALFVGHFLPELVLSSLMRNSHFRKYLLGEAWVEGYWATLTTFKDGEKRKGIVQIRYAGERYSELEINGWLKTEEIIHSHSTYATVDNRLHLVNYFRTSGPQPRTGVAVGELSCTHGKHPNEYHGMRFYVADDHATEVYQRAIKLNASDVMKCKRELGERWINFILSESGHGSDFLLQYYDALQNKLPRIPLLEPSK